MSCSDVGVCARKSSPFFGQRGTDSNESLLSETRGVFFRALFVVKLIEIIKSRWLGHPLHPAIVHVPIGAWFAAFVLDLIIQAEWINAAAAARLALYCVAAGLLGALIAVPFGLADWASITEGKPARKIGLYHLLVNFTATGVWGLNFFFRLSVGGTRTNGAILSTSIIATVLVLVGGYLGSLMAFAHGVTVTRHSKPELRARAGRNRARVQDERSVHDER
jgi:uncharacterized membrane protein